MKLDKNSQRYEKLKKLKLSCINQKQISKLSQNFQKFTNLGIVLEFFWFPAQIQFLTAFWGFFLNFNTYPKILGIDSIFRFKFLLREMYISKSFGVIEAHTTWHQTNIRITCEVNLLIKDKNDKCLIGNLGECLHNWSEIDSRTYNQGRHNLVNFVFRSLFMTTLITV